MPFADWFSWFKKPAEKPAEPEASRAVPFPPRPLAKSPHEWLNVKPMPPEKPVAAVVEIDSAKAYPYWLNLLGVTAVDQYWIEVAYQCIKLDAQSAVVGTDYDPRTAGKSVGIHFSRAEDFALTNFPIGRGLAAATRGKEARGHYTRIRGRLPM